jgi:septum formation protein
VAVRYPDEVVLGADTVVVIGGVALGKPVDEAEAGDMLRRLSGHWHQVVTGVCLTRAGDGWERAWTCATDVRFRELDHAGIQRYIARVHVLDKAGAYAIQECGEMIVAETRGLVSNVIGLPVEEVVRELP